MISHPGFKSWSVYILHHDYHFFSLEEALKLDRMVTSEDSEIRKLGWSIVDHHFGKLRWGNGKYVKEEENNTTETS